MSNLTTLKKGIAAMATWQLTALLSFNRRDAMYNRAVNNRVINELRKRGYEKHIQKD